LAFGNYIGKRSEIILVNYIGKPLLLNFVRVNISQSAAKYESETKAKNLFPSYRTIDVILRAVMNTKFYYNYTTY